MTLDEAIEHCQNKCESLCGQCAEDREQLAIWLKEYKELKAKVESVYNDDCEYCPICGHIIRYYIVGADGSKSCRLTSSTVAKKPDMAKEDTAHK